MITGSFPVNRNNDGVDNVPDNTNTPLSYLTLIGAGSYDATVVRRWATKANSANITVPLDLELGLLFIRGLNAEQGFIMDFKRFFEFETGDYGGNAQTQNCYPILFINANQKFYFGRTTENKLLFAADAVAHDVTPLILYRMPLHFAI